MTRALRNTSAIMGLPFDLMSPNSDLNSWVPCHNGEGDEGQFGQSEASNPKPGP